MFEETLGINDLPPEVLTTKSQFEDGETGIYYNKFTLGDTEISFMVTPLEIRE